MEDEDYAAFVGAWKGLLATADANGYFRHLTRDWERVLGWSEAELMAQPFVEFVHPEDRAATIAAATRLAEGDQVTHFVNRYGCKDGSYKWILWTSSVEGSTSTAGRLIHATAHDITEHVETQQRLEAALAEVDNFRRMLEATSDHVGMADLDGHILYTNRAGLEMIGATAEALEGTHISKLHPPAYAERVGRAGIPHAIEQGAWRGEGELLRADGSTIPISQVIVPIRDASGAVSATGTFIRDISEAKALEAELRAQTERLTATLAAMSTPLIPITREVVVMPLIGQIDADRAEQVITAALDGVERSGARVVILDITGLAAVDTQVAAALVQAAQALRLLGARTILTGIQPAVAQTLVGLGLDLEGVATHGTLQKAIAAALRELA